MYFHRSSPISKLLIGLVFGLLITFTLRCVFFSSAKIVVSGNNIDKCSPKRIISNTVFDISDGKRELVLIGVMSADNFLETRAKAVYETWGKEIPGRLLFFTPENTDLLSHLPIVALPTVDDSYPPQKKSFLTLKYMYENYGEKFEWFMRADDDVYVRTDKLEKLLRSLNSSIKFFIGQAGMGNKDELGHLNLEYDENFCMGGPGMIMSYTTLAAVAPNVKYCLQNLYSHHEDTEIGRCVQKFSGSSCTWAYEMQNIFYHNSAGWDAFTGNLKTKEVLRAITLHPFKQHVYMYKMHNYVRALRINDLAYERIVQRRRLKGAIELKNMTFTPQNDRELRQKEATRISLSFMQKPSSNSEMIPWDFISRSWYTVTQLNPRRKLNVALNEAIDDLAREVMEELNTHSRERGRIIDLKEIFYVSYSINPVYGVQYIIDLILTYKKYRGRKMTVPVRYHKIYQQNFLPLALQELSPKRVPGMKRDEMKSSRKLLSAKKREKKLTNLFKVSLDYIHDLEEEYDTFRINYDQDSKGLTQMLKVASDELTYKAFQEFQSFNTGKAPEKIINIIVPISGRVKAFQRFLSNYEDVVLKNHQNVKLVLVLYNDPKNPNSKLIAKGILENYKNKYKNFDVTVTEPKYNESFSRGKALEYGAALHSNDSLLFVNDVDVLFTADALLRIRLHTVQNYQIYFPVVFSEYNPKYGHGETSEYDNFCITATTGYWRTFGYGIVSIYKSDLANIGGFDKNIVGWGKEDVDLFEKSVASNLTIFRAADPGLVHVFHEIECDEALEASQMNMCLGSKINTVYSPRYLADFFLHNSTLKSFAFNVRLTQSP